jgi:hypothetical protein
MGCGASSAAELAEPERQRGQLARHPSRGGDGHRFRGPRVRNVRAQGKAGATWGAADSVDAVAQHEHAAAVAAEIAALEAEIAAMQAQSHQQVRGPPSGQRGDAHGDCAGGDCCGRDCCGRERAGGERR